MRTGDIWNLKICKQLFSFWDLNLNMCEATFQVAQSIIDIRDNQIESIHLAYIMIFWCGDSGPCIMLWSAVNRQSGDSFWQSASDMFTICSGTFSRAWNRFSVCDNASQMQMHLRPCFSSEKKWLWRRVWLVCYQCDAPTDVHVSEEPHVHNKVIGISIHCTYVISCRVADMGASVWLYCAPISTQNNDMYTASPHST
jgi:hypothetical protein